MKQDKVMLVEKKSSTEEPKYQNIHFSEDFVWQQFNVLQSDPERTGLLPPSGWPSISAAYLALSMDYKVSLRVHPNNLILQRKTVIIRPMHNIEMLAWLHLEGKLFHWKTGLHTSQVKFLLVFYFAIKISFYHGRKLSQIPESERWGLSQIKHWLQ